MDRIDETKSPSKRRYPVLMFHNNPAQWLTIRLAMEQCFPEVEPIVMSTRVTARAYLDTVSIVSRATPRIIFIDLSVSHSEDGLSFLIELKSDPRFNKIPVIILSDSETPNDILLAFTLGAAGYVTKPLNYSDWLVCFCNFKPQWWELAKLPLST